MELAAESLQEMERYQRFRFAGGVTVDVARFALACGKTEAALVHASARMQAAFEAEGGFLGRLLTQDAQGVYLDILYWARAPEALPSMAQRIAAGGPSADFVACMADPAGDGPPVDALLRGMVTATTAAGMKH